MTKDYGRYDLHLELVDAMDRDDEVLAGFAIPREDLTSFLFDLGALVKKYGVDYLELLDEDLGDESLSAAIKADMAAGEGRRIGDALTVEPVEADSDQDRA